jgi:hypothetical protein
MFQAVEITSMVNFGYKFGVVVAMVLREEECQRAVEIEGVKENCGFFFRGRVLNDVGEGEADGALEKSVMVSRQF